MDEKSEYKNICQQYADEIPVYSQYWWMEAACVGKCWNAFVVKDKAGRLMATMPYLIRKKYGLKYILMPPLTQTNGIHYFYPDDISEHQRLEFEKTVVNEIVARLDNLGISFFSQNFESSFTNWLPFLWNGFRQTTRYTYRLPSLKDLNSVYNGFTKDRKKKIQRAVDSGLVLKQDLTPEAFYDFHCAVLAKHGQENLVDRAVVTSVMRAAIERGQGIILSLHSQDCSAMYSAQFLVWNSKWTCSLVCANDPDFTSTGASTLILWESIKFASQHSTGFDFEGSVEESIESSYNRFGSKQTPYMKISKSYGLLFRFKDAFDALFAKPNV